MDQLKERAEANAKANTEFKRVKRAKLENERAKQHANGARDERAERQLERERANRASAAASRAKIVCYARELEHRTDRLESDRNWHCARADKAQRKLTVLRDEARSLKRVLRALWELKHPDTCAYLVDSNALFLLGSHAEDDTDSDDSPQPPPAANGPKSPTPPSHLPPRRARCPAAAQSSASPQAPPTDLPSPGPTTGSPTIHPRPGPAIPLGVPVPPPAPLASTDRTRTYCANPVTERRLFTLQKLVHETHDVKKVGAPTVAPPLSHAPSEQRSYREQPYVSAPSRAYSPRVTSALRHPSYALATSTAQPTRYDRAPQPLHTTSSAQCWLPSQQHTASPPHVAFSTGSRGPPPHGSRPSLASPRSLPPVATKHVPRNMDYGSGPTVPPAYAQPRPYIPPPTTFAPSSRSFPSIRIPGEILRPADRGVLVGKPEALRDRA